MSARASKQYRIVHRQLHADFITKGATRSDAHRLASRLGYDRYAVFNTWTRQESHAREVDRDH